VPLKRISWCCVPLLALLSLLTGNISGTDINPIRRVLVINEVSTAWPGIPLIDEGIRSELEPLPYKVEVYREYMDTIYFPDPADQQRITEISRDVQALSHRLHSSKLEFLGLCQAAKGFCRELSEKANVEIQFNASEISSTIPKEVSLVCSVCCKSRFRTR